MPAERTKTGASGVQQARTATPLSPYRVFPAGGPGVQPGAQNPPAVINGGSWNGQCFRSSGVIFGPPPPKSTVFTLTFSKAGTYTFQCTVHEDMKGTVKVG